MSSSRCGWSAVAMVLFKLARGGAFADFGSPDFGECGGAFPELPWPLIGASAG
jgi:hypothetical protein